MLSGFLGPPSPIQSKRFAGDVSIQTGASRDTTLSSRGSRRFQGEAVVPINPADFGGDDSSFDSFSSNNSVMPFDWSGAGGALTNQYDPIGKRHRIERAQASALRANRYGIGTAASLKRAMYRSKGIVGQEGRVRDIQAQLLNRMNDGFIGRNRGMYSAGMPLGRGRYKRRRNRGMYSAGMPLGRGSYYDSVWKPTRKWANAGSAAMSAGSSLAAAMGRPDIASGLSTGSRMAKGLARFANNRGAYNSLFPEMGPEPIAFTSTKSEHSTLLVTGQERVQTIYGNTFNIKDDPTSGVKPFTVINVPVTPCHSEYFPKLAQAGVNFSEYEIIGLVFVYKSTIQTNWTTETVQTGKAIMATEYDVSQPAWTTHGELMRDEHHTEGLLNGVTIEDRVHYHGIECDPRKLTTKGLKFVRTQGLEEGKDLKDYDLARFSLGIFGSAASMADIPIGELWVQYKVLFKSHRQYSALGLSIPHSIMRNTDTQDLGTISTNNDYRHLALACSNFKHDMAFNNISFKVDRLQNQIAQVDGRVAYCAVIQITFSSQTSGDFKIQWRADGNNFPAWNQAGGYAESTPSILPMEALVPTTTGILQLNHDCPVINTANAGTDDSTHMSSFECYHTRNGVFLETRIHTSEATSTEDNSVTLLLPVALMAITADPGNDSVTINNFASNDFTGDVDTVVHQCSLDVQQYNAHGKFGSAGLPFLSTTYTLAAPDAGA